jgi:hypothetical protein
MKISKKENYTLITATENSFTDFFNAFTKDQLDKVTTHKVVQLSENLNTTIENLSLFLNIANNHRTNGISFVVLVNGIDIDDVPEEINIVPTITEAKDLLEMEAIERDLGF